MDKLGKGSQGLYNPIKVDLFEVYSQLQSVIRAVSSAFRAPHSLRRSWVQILHRASKIEVGKHTRSCRIPFRRSYFGLYFSYRALAQWWRSIVRMTDSINQVDMEDK